MTDNVDGKHGASWRLLWRWFWTGQEANVVDVEQVWCVNDGRGRGQDAPLCSEQVKICEGLFLHTYSCADHATMWGVFHEPIHWNQEQIWGYCASLSYSTQDWELHLSWRKVDRSKSPLKVSANVGVLSDSRKFSEQPRAHHAVFFAVAQLSCN